MREVSDSFIDILFKEGHILHLKSETVAFRRRMNLVFDDYVGQMIPGTNGSQIS